MVATRFVVPLVVAVLMLGACTDDDSAGPPTTSRSSSTSASSTNSSTSSTDPAPIDQPPATDTLAVKPVLQALVNSYDDAVEAILADPQVANNRASTQVDTYLDLFVPGSTFPETALSFWAGEGQQGHFYRPGPRGQMYDSAVQMVQPTSDEDQVTFTVCTATSIRIVDASGEQLSSEGGLTAGSVVAIRADGIWRLRDLTRTSTEGCPDPRTPS